MSRTTKVVGLSIPPEIHKRIEKHIKNNHKTRSEFFREIINAYFSEKIIPKSNDTETDIANLLKNYWSLRSKSDLKIIIIGLGIITNKDGKVLIGVRKFKDMWVENLSWVFPGGELKSLDLKKNVISIIKRETNLDANLENLVSVRIHPDSGYKNVQIIALYFHCNTSDEKNIRASGDLKELKWVNPLDVFKYFTTSTSDEVTNFLFMLAKSNINT